MDDNELRRHQEEAFMVLGRCMEREGATVRADRRALELVRDLASEARKFQSLLAMMNNAYLSLRNRKNAEIAELKKRLAEYE
jgi:hypothetical protein